MMNKTIRLTNTASRTTGPIEAATPRLGMSWRIVAYGTSINNVIAQMRSRAIVAFCQIVTPLLTPP
jgi:hypothetical protein